MIRIPLEPVPNQQFVINIENRLFDISVNEGQSRSTLLTVSIDGAAQFNGMLSVHAARLRLRDWLDNYLLWLCDDGASYPHFSLFGSVGDAMPIHGLFKVGPDDFPIDQPSR